MPPSPAIMVLTTLPDAQTAQRIAHALVEHRLAACVSVMAPCASVYRWQGAIETATEVPLMIKTVEARYPEVETRLRELHPYALPEIVVLPIVRGLPGYLDWIGASTAAEDGR